MTLFMPISFTQWHWPMMPFAVLYSFFEFVLFFCFCFDLNALPTVIKYVNCSIVMQYRDKILATLFQNFNKYLVIYLICFKVYQCVPLSFCNCKKESWKKGSKTSLLHRSTEELGEKWLRRYSYASHNKTSSMHK